MNAKLAKTNPSQKFKEVKCQVRLSYVLADNKKQMQMGQIIGGSFQNEKCHTKYLRSHKIHLLKLVSVGEAFGRNH